MMFVMSDESAGCRRRGGGGVGGGIDREEHKSCFPIRETFKSQIYTQT